MSVTGFGITVATGIFKQALRLAFVLFATSKQKGAECDDHAAYCGNHDHEYTSPQRATNKQPK